MTATPRPAIVASRIRGRTAQDQGTEPENPHDQDAKASAAGSDSISSVSSLSPTGDPSSSRTWRIQPASDDMGTSGSRSGKPAAGLGSAVDSGQSQERPSVLDEFIAAWERGEAPAVEEYLDRLAPSDSRGAVELIYREFCLAEAAGDNPEPSAFLNRFPQHKESLERLLQLHSACSSSLLGGWVECASAALELPGVGDAIGPFVLRRELGRGSFARVFLAEQADLEDRLVVVKLSTRRTREPWLLARARHANIVEIVSHATVNDGDYQLMCMPFWGGATLAAVLAVGRERGRPPVSGRDLLADLDSVAAPEYPAVQPTRPAREILASLSYSQAVAWVAARLAEALDHAFSRDVAHGDIKPSNVLLSADGNPMLLDFNLARDGSPAGSSWSDNDLGGTLAYMAPERLGKLATAEPNGEDSRTTGRSFTDRDIDSPSNASPAQAAEMLDRGPHLADIYALGVVLLEALTARPPEQVTIAGNMDPASSTDSVKTAAAAYTVVRARSARDVIGEAESAGGRAIPSGLRPILERCLDPDPAKRYRRAWELAEDLNRWRTDRALAFAAEPFWRQTIPRFLRRQRRMVMVTTVALSVLIGLPTTAVVVLKTRLDQEDLALFKLARHWDDVRAGAFRHQRPELPRFLEPSNPQAFETARRALEDYGVVGKDDSVDRTQDWRQRPDVSRLPKSDRDDFELWLMEQTYRYCRGLEDRPNSVEHWRRALAILDHVGASTPLPAFSTLSQRLRRKLGDQTPATRRSSASSSARPATALVSPWLDEYLLGVAAESDRESGSDQTLIQARRRAAERAVAHYGKLLALRPDSFWGHYRAAAGSYALDLFAEAVFHLQRCIQRRESNSVLSGQLAGCLMKLGRYDEAMIECDRAIAGAPDFAELFRSRAWIRVASGRTQGLAEDLQRFELLSGRLPRSLLNRLSTARALDGGRPAGPAGPHSGTMPNARDVETRRDTWAAEFDAEGKNREADADDLDARVVLAMAIRQAGEIEIASAELEKILILDPDHIHGLWMHAIRAMETHHFDVAKRDLYALLGHPGLGEYFRKTPESIVTFRYIIRDILPKVEIEEAQTIGRQALNVAISLQLDRGELHYYLGQALAIEGRKKARFIDESAEQLFCAFVANEEYINKYKNSDSFNPVRAQIDRALESEMHRRGHSIPFLKKVP
jgi:eukaryotic-like serine/threonine-protein kinase